MSEGRDRSIQTNSPTSKDDRAFGGQSSVDNVSPPSALNPGSPPFKRASFAVPLRSPQEKALFVFSFSATDVFSPVSRLAWWMRIKIKDTNARTNLHAREPFEGSQIRLIARSG